MLLGLNFHEEIKIGFKLDKAIGPLAHDFH